MSESIRAWLVQGIAAAKEKEIEEARFCLEKVIRSSDASFDQRERAWLWLSQVTDDPKERRNCLEEALAINPANAPARRGLAILDGRVTDEATIEPHQKVEPVQFSPAASSSDVRRYVCPKCGGKMAYDAAKRRVSCAYCGNAMSEYQALMDGVLIKEHDFAVMLPTLKAHRWHLPGERTFNCQSCGATISLPPAHITHACPFCASAHIVRAGASDAWIQPESVLPFQFDADAALGHVRTWLEKLRFRPGDLDEKAALSRPQGFYLPFWTFDVGGEITWRALVREERGNQSEWVPRNGNYLVFHDDLLVPASHSLPADLISQLSGFDTKALVAYADNLLADWPAEIYQIAMADASLVARRRAFEAAKEHVRYRSLGGETVRDLTLNSSGVSIDTYKLTLLPVWIASYRYKKDRFALLVNGQSGDVVGRAPRGGFQKLLANIFGGKG
jgi:predicted RNA-binding Zn-ribbon protein involved in translation (DUF1610 family)